VKAKVGGAPNKTFLKNWLEVGGVPDGTFLEKWVELLMGKLAGMSKIDPL